MGEFLFQTGISLKPNQTELPSKLLLIKVTFQEPSPLRCAAVVILWEDDGVCVPIVLTAGVGLRAVFLFSCSNNGRE